MKLGIGTYTYTWNFGTRTKYPSPPEVFTVDRLFQIAHEKGIHLVQLVGDAVPMHEMSAEQLAALAQQAKELAIELEVGTTGVEPATLATYLAVCKAVGGKLVRTIMDSKDSHPSVEQAAEWIRGILPEYKRAGVRLAIENHDKRTVKELQQLMDMVDDPALGVCLDMVNSLGAQECQKEVVSALLPYTISMHYKDFTISRMDHDMGLIVTGCTAGQGLTDMDYILANRGKAQSDFNIILEQWVPFYQTIEETVAVERRQADEGIQYLQTKYRDLWETPCSSV